MIEHAVVGTSIPRVDGAEKVTGQARFTGDLHIPGMLHTRLVLSPYANAKIASIDATEARKVPGVVGVYVAEDLAFVEPDSGSRKRDFLARGRALYHGHPVAAVVAESAAAAEDAMSLVDVDFVPQDAAVDLIDAMRPDAPLARGEKPTEASAEAQMHATASGGDEEPSEEQPPNVATTLHFHRGDVEAGFAEADAIVEQTYRTAMVHQGYLEPQVTMTTIDPLGTLTVYTSTQALFYTRAEVCAALGLPNNKVKVVGMTIGGGFGGKFMLLEALCAALSLKTNRPVLLEYTRMDDFLAANPAPPSEFWIKLGAKKDGTITALQARVVFDTGAYSGSPIQIGSILLGASYRFPNLDIRGYEVLTNKTPAGAYRAPGAVQAAFAMESTIDMLAKELGADPFELRRTNAAKEGDLRPNNQPWPKIGLHECLDEAAGHWQRLRAERVSASDVNDDGGKTALGANVKIGVGMAIGGWPGGVEPATAICRLNTDGTFSVVIGSIDLSGTDTAFKQIAAESLGLPTSAVEIVHGDTDTAPYSGGTGGSKITYTVGLAIQRAGEEARQQLLAIASQQLEAGIDDLEIVDGIVRVKGVPEQSVPIKALAAASMSFGGKHEPVYGRGSSAQTMQSPGFAVHIAKVAVDADTGKVKVLDYVAVQDVGFAINPAEVDGQIVGGVLQGLGWALWEKMAYDETGQIITASLQDYVIPSASYAPTITPVLVEVPSAYGPFGAKGIGEPPVIPVPGAVANAIADALGSRLVEIPITSQAIARAMHLGGGTNGAAH